LATQKSPLLLPNPEAFPPKTEINRKKTRNSPQLTTNAEELFYPQLTGPTSAIDLRIFPKIIAFEGRLLVEESLANGGVRLGRRGRGLGG
jgi:hypothetical protein